MKKIKKVKKTVAANHLHKIATTAICLKNRHGADSKCITVDFMDKVILLAGAYKKFFLWDKYSEFIPQKNLLSASKEELQELLDQIGIVWDNEKDPSRTLLDNSLSNVMELVNSDNPIMLCVGEEDAMAIFDIASFNQEYDWMDKYEENLLDGPEQLEVIIKLFKAVLKGRVGCKFKFNEKKQKVKVDKPEIDSEKAA